MASGNSRPVHRRTFLQAAAVSPWSVPIVAGAAFGQSSATSRAAVEHPSQLGQERSAVPPQTADMIASYLETLRRNDGGYGWDDNNPAHLTPTYAAVGCYQRIGREPPESTALATWVRTHHPFHLKKLERDLKAFEYQQIQTLRWLAAPVDEFIPLVEQWQKPALYPRQYEQHGYPPLDYEATVFLSRQMLQLPVEGFSPSLVQYFEERRRANGSFNFTPAADGSDGNLLLTWWGLQVWEALGRSLEQRDLLIAWIQNCQRPAGGFTHQPEPFMAGLEDVIYTWAAVRSLALLGASPRDRSRCELSLNALHNSDGGFAARPDWPSNPLATFYALDAFHALERLARLPQSKPAIKAPSRSVLPDDLQVFTMQIEAPGSGSPADAVALARGLKIHLWAAKNAAPGWAEAAQTIANREQVPVRFCVGNEEYGTFVELPGQGIFSHTCDLVAPAETDIGQPIGRQIVNWETFRKQRLEPLNAGHGRLVWQFNENEALTRLYLDDSLIRGGYAAISSFHFGNPDFTNSSPFLMQYRDQIPYVGLQDAHGEEAWWWGDMLTGFRTLFLAREATWESWLEALAAGHVLAARRDGASLHQLWLHGRGDVVAFAAERARRWQWWNNAEIERPAASLVVLTPQSRFEAGRPESGVAVRVRYACENSTQGKPKTPLVEPISLTINGKIATPQHRVVGPQSKPNDRYDLHLLENAAPGTYLAVVMYRWRETGREGQQSIKFTV